MKVVVIAEFEVCLLKEKADVYLLFSLGVHSFSCGPELTNVITFCNHSSSANVFSVYDIDT